MKSFTVTNRDQDAELRLHVGDELIVRLEVIPGTGYSWMISGDDIGMLSQVADTVFEKSDAEVLGGIEQQLFRFRVKSSGMRQLVFEYRRPWEKSGTAAKSYSVKLLIEQ